jgi:hypothetical protein
MIPTRSRLLGGRDLPDDLDDLDDLAAGEQEDLENEVLDAATAAQTAAELTAPQAPLTKRYEAKALATLCHEYPGSLRIPVGVSQSNCTSAADMQRSPRMRSGKRDPTQRTTGLDRRHVDETAVVTLERDCHCGRRTVPVLGHDQVSLASSRRLSLVGVLAVKQDHDVSILLDTIV